MRIFRRRVNHHRPSIRRFRRYSRSLRCRNPGALASRRVLRQGALRRQWPSPLPRNATRAEDSPRGPVRAALRRPPGCVAALAKGDGHSLQAAPCRTSASEPQSPWITTAQTPSPAHYPQIVHQSPAKALRQGAARRQWPSPLARAATPRWRFCRAPFGQASDPPSAALRWLERATAIPAPSRLASDGSLTC